MYAIRSYYAPCADEPGLRTTNSPYGFPSVVHDLEFQGVPDGEPTFQTPDTFWVLNAEASPAVPVHCVERAHESDPLLYKDA